MPLQQTVHAEQSAITHARLRGEKGLRKVTVNYTPCGHCRQFMNELNSGTDLLIQLPELAAMPLKTLLPHAFGPVDLGIKTRYLTGASRLSFPRHQCGGRKSARGSQPQPCAVFSFPQRCGSSGQPRTHLQRCLH